MKRPWGNLRIFHEWQRLADRINRRIASDQKKGKTPRYSLIPGPTVLPFEFQVQPPFPPPR